ncbi:hypothetical protein [Embleya sp. NPDC059237]|uniref:hypothetical protein n=1 Tax=Embleya sp. NPDC059237 TaxID=3346784 RepID=UPI003686D977
MAPVVASFELRSHRTRTDVGVFAFGVVVSAMAWLSDLPPALAIFVWGFFGLGGVLVLLGPVFRPVVLRVDADGVALHWGFGRAPRVVAWADVETVVSWRGNGMRWVGVVASADYRRRAGLEGGRSGRWLDRAVGMPVSRTVTTWDGPADELKALVAAVWRFAPDTPWADLSHPDHHATPDRPSPA